MPEVTVNLRLGGEEPVRIGVWLSRQGLWEDQAAADLNPSRNGRWPVAGVKERGWQSGTMFGDQRERFDCSNIKSDEESLKIFR